MVYLDTNVLVYASVNQDAIKHKQSLDLIERLVKQNELVLSVLTLQELSYTLAKLGLDYDLITQDIEFYQSFVQGVVDVNMFNEAHDLAVRARRLTSLNDAVHAVYAKHFATKIVTFDQDFVAFQMHTPLTIEVLR